MPLQTRLATEYRAAPRVAFNNGSQALAVAGGADRFDITSVIPYKAQLEQAPFVDLILSFLVNGTDLGPVVAVAPAGLLATAEQYAAYHRRGFFSGWASIVVPRLLPRDDAAATELLDGNRVYLVNVDAQNTYTVYYAALVPTLDWE